MVCHIKAIGVVNALEGASFCVFVMAIMGPLFHPKGDSLAGAIFARDVTLVESALFDVSDTEFLLELVHVVRMKEGKTSLVLPLF